MGCGGRVVPERLVRVGSGPCVGARVVDGLDDPRVGSGCDAVGELVEAGVDELVGIGAGAGACVGVRVGAWVGVDVRVGARVAGAVGVVAGGFVLVGVPGLPGAGGTAEGAAGGAGAAGGGVLGSTVGAGAGVAPSAVGVAPIGGRSLVPLRSVGDEVRAGAGTTAGGVTAPR